ncbi:MAG: ABC transporter ATP-binding protein [Thermoproteota archaeon]|nr:ABC transporter ATP-binding protein [Candidatus Brockarchaeota archaeon]
MSLLEVCKVSVEYKTWNSKIEALNDVSFSLSHNEILGILGESGSGKSTLALTIMKALPKNAKVRNGKIIYKDKDLLNLSESMLNSIRWKEISIVPQNSMNSLSPVHKIGDQLYDILKLHNPSIEKKEALEIIKEKLTISNLGENIVDKYPHQLSGGMRQRVLIATSLLCEPKIILADEPTTGLDVVTQYQILKELKELQDKIKFSMIIISHDISVIVNISQRVLVMYNGQVVEEGKTQSILEEPMHPYTKALFEVQLMVGRIKKEDLKIVEKQDNKIQNFENFSGCVFYFRCPFATQRCKNENPRLTKVKNEHSVACFLYG